MIIVICLYGFSSFCSEGMQTSALKTDINICETLDVGQMCNLCREPISHVSSEYNSDTYKTEDELLYMIDRFKCVCAQRERERTCMFVLYRVCYFTSGSSAESFCSRRRKSSSS